MPVYEYFHPWDADQYTFYRVPKRLFTDEHLQDMSYGAKLLYGMLLDRVSLSSKNGWIDDAGHIYIIFTQQEIMENLNVTDKPATRMMNELEQHGLVERKIQGLGRPAILYLKNFASDSPNVTLQTRRISDSGVGQSTSQDSENLRRNNTNNNNTDEMETDVNQPDMIVDPDYRFTITPWHEVAGERTKDQGEQRRLL